MVMGRPKTSVGTGFVALLLGRCCLGSKLGQLPHVLDVVKVQGVTAELEGIRLRGILFALGQVAEALSELSDMEGPQEVSPSCIAAFWDGPFALSSHRVHSMGSPVFDIEEEKKAPADQSLVQCWWAEGSCWVVRLDYTARADMEQVVTWATGSGIMPGVTGSATMLLSLPLACTLQEAALYLAPQLLDLRQMDGQEAVVTQASLLEIRPGSFEVARTHRNLSRWIPHDSGRAYPEEAVDSFGAECVQAATSKTASLAGFRFHEIFGRVLCSPSVYSNPEDFTGAAAGLKIYVQSLTSSLNADRLVVASLVRVAHNFSCDPGFFPCSKTSWEGEWSAWRQHAGEVAFLQKILTAPPEVLVGSADEADLIVVPGLFQFASSKHMFRQLHRSCPRDIMKELEHLKFMLPEQTPHLFVFADHMNNLRESDPGGFNCYISRHPDNIFISHGSELSAPGYITMPPVVTESELHPWNSASETRETFLLYSENVDCCHPVRKYLHDVLVSDLGKAHCNSQCIVEATQSETSTSETDGIDQTRAMRQAIFCPLGPGEVPHRHKFYKAILAGCIPVLFDFPSYFPEQRSWWKEFGSPYQLSIPFVEVIPYEDFVVTVPCTDNYTQSALDMLWKMRSMSAKEITRRQDSMRKWRHMLAFRWDGEGPDAFTAIMQQIGVIWKRTKRI
ncbi:KIFC3 [Symbiodinium natans]|uniref:KIFC3 protein n=1 Tax=Symbiodinium natans TaxID=878477 RepID=A0A812TMJ1_9DINO|nr:KIFC3 [Symbiodinium natans]